MTTGTSLALALLAVCDALDAGLTDAVVRAKAIGIARRRCHAVLAAEHGHPPKAMCQCPDELYGPCDCTTECMCAAMAQGEQL